jgi:hypothetical protein
MADAEARKDDTPISPLRQRAIEIDVAEAFHSVLTEHLGESPAAELFQQVVDRLAVSAAHGLHERYPGPSLADLWEVWSSHLGADGRLELQLDELSEQRLRFHVDRCAYADLYRSRGQEEIGIAFSCRRDKPFAEALIPGVTVEQSKTILEGNHRCEFTYTLEDR